MKVLSEGFDQPKIVWESKDYAFNFTDALPGATIASAENWLSIPKGLTFGTPTIFAGNKKVTADISGGTGPENYCVACRVTGSDGNKYEARATLKVLPNAP